MKYKSIIQFCLLFIFVEGFVIPKKDIRSSLILDHRSSKRKNTYIYDDRTMTSGGFGTGGEPPFEIRGFSLSNVILTIGFIIGLSSFAEYFLSTFENTSDIGGVSGLGFVYGLPIVLVGAALKYGEIPPVPVKSTKTTKVIYDLKKTSTIGKINKDVTRHRYGDEAHLDTTLKALGLVIPQKSYPQLQYIQYGISKNNELEFTMVWQSLETPFNIWNEETRIEKYDTFFGPGVWSQVLKVNSTERLVGIKLTTGKRPASEVLLPELGVWRMGCDNIE